MQQEATGSFNTPQVPNSSAGLQPPAPIRNQWQDSEGLHPLTTTPGITQNSASGNTPSTSFVMAPGTLTGMAPGVVPGSTLNKSHGKALPGSTPAKTTGTTLYTPSTTLERVSDTTSDITPGSISSTATGIAPRIFPDTTPGSCNTAKVDLVAAAPRSNNASSATKMPRQVATPRQQPIFQCQKRKALVIAASPSRQQGTNRPNASTASEPVHKPTLHHSNQTSDPQQQVHPSLAMPVSGVHQPSPDDTAAQSSSKGRRKKLLQQRVLPF